MRLDDIELHLYRLSEGVEGYTVSDLIERLQKTLGPDALVDFGKIYNTAFGVKAGDMDVSTAMLCMREYIGLGVTAMKVTPVQTGIQPGHECPCGKKTKVVDCRNKRMKGDKHVFRYRRRECECGKRWHTKEIRKD